MKKNIITIITFSFFMFSCTTNETLDSQDYQISKIMSGPSINIDIDDDDNEDLRKKLELYSYTIGRVLLKHLDARTEILNNITNNVLDLNMILANNSTIRTDFLYELNHLRLNNYGINDHNGGPNRDSNPNTIYPPITTRDYTPLFYNITVDEIENEILSNNYNDCLEMYLARSFNFSLFEDNNGNISTIIHTTPHPLSDNESPEGFSLFFNSFLRDYGYNNLFDNTFLSTHSRNVIVIRPVRNNTCSYNNINVVDFTSYYQN